MHSVPEQKIQDHLQTDLEQNGRGGGTAGGTTVQEVAGITISIEERWRVLGKAASTFRTMKVGFGF